MHRAAESSAPDVRDIHFAERGEIAANVGDEAAADPALASATAARNSTLGGAYLMLAARALGLDCGPMSGFDADAVNAEFFPDGRWRANFLVNLGYGDPASVFPRNPRLPFATACQVL